MRLGHRRSASSRVSDVTGGPCTRDPGARHLEASKLHSFVGLRRFGLTDSPQLLQPPSTDSSTANLQYAKSCERRCYGTDGATSYLLMLHASIEWRLAQQRDWHDKTVSIPFALIESITRPRESRSAISDRRLSPMMADTGTKSAASAVRPHDLS